MLIVVLGVWWNCSSGTEYATLKGKSETLYIPWWFNYLDCWIVLIVQEKNRSNHSSTIWSTLTVIFSAFATLCSHVHHRRNFHNVMNSFDTFSRGRGAKKRWQTWWKWTGASWIHRTVSIEIGRMSPRSLSLTGVLCFISFIPARYLKPMTSSIFRRTLTR